MKTWDALWIDDLRPAPEGWVWAKTSKQAIELLSNPNTVFRIISFDHDLGLDDNGNVDTAMAVVLYIEELSAQGLFYRFNWGIHSDNPRGRDDLKAALLSCERFWNRYDL